VKLKREWVGYGLTAPAYIWLCITVILPMIVMLYFSFLSTMPMGTAEPVLSLKQYATFFEKDFYRFLTWRSLLLGVHVTVLCVLIGYPAALILAQVVKGRWREAILLLLVFPFWSNALIRTFSWTMVLRTDGIVDQVLHFLLPGAPSVGILYSYPAIVIGLTHSFLPYMILTSYISLQTIDDSLIEAGQALGASNFTVFRRVIMPLSVPGLMREMEAFVSALELKRTVFRSDHASNWLVLRGTLGSDKPRLLEQLRAAIASPETARLRPAWARGL